MTSAQGTPESADDLETRFEAATAETPHDLLDLSDEVAAWPSIVDAPREDQMLAIAVAAPLGVAMYGGFLNAILAGIYAERHRVASLTSTDPI